MQCSDYVETSCNVININLLIKFWGVGKGGSKGAAAHLVFCGCTNGIHYFFFDSTFLFKFVPVDLCTYGFLHRDYVILITSCVLLYLTPVSYN